MSYLVKVQAQEKKKPGKLSKIFNTPSTADRIEKSQKTIATVLPDRDEYVLSTSEFDIMKAKLIALDNMRGNRLRVRIKMAHPETPCPEGRRLRRAPIARRRSTDSQTKDASDNFLGKDRPFASHDHRAGLRILDGIQSLVASVGSHARVVVYPKITNPWSFYQEALVHREGLCRG